MNAIGNFVAFAASSPVAIEESDASLAVKLAIFLPIMAVLAWWAVVMQGKWNTFIRDLQVWREDKDRLRMTNADGDQWEAWIKRGRELSSRTYRLVHADVAQKRNIIDHDLGVYENARAHASMNQQAYVSMSHHTSGSGDPEHIRELARLRAEGVISQDEFAAFTVRFQRSPVSKAMEIVQSIQALNSQQIKGAMSQSNYRSSVWALMDSLDRDLK